MLCSFFCFDLCRPIIPDQCLQEHFFSKIFNDFSSYYIEMHPYMKCLQAYFIAALIFRRVVESYALTKHVLYVDPSIGQFEKD
jgi:hypothetical protein